MYKIERGLIGKLNGNLCVNVMLDKKNNEVWGTQHADCNSYVKYADNNIVLVFGNNPIFQEKFTKKILIERINDCL